MNPTPSESSALSASSALNPPENFLSGSEPWAHLRRFTAARIALGRTGGSLLTRELLAFNHDHALARDAVYAPFDAEALSRELRALPISLDAHIFETTASDRASYLQRPDLGRRLSEASVARLAALTKSLPPPDLVILVSDGLSALAAHRQVPPLLAALVPRLRRAGFSLAPLCVVRHARVALQDKVGALYQARFALMLLGERPGLGTPDSLGAYFTFAPGPGRTDADRNCVSNIREAGLTPILAAEKITRLLVAARDLGASGTALKESDPPPAKISPAP